MERPLGFSDARTLRAGGDGPGLTAHGMNRCESGPASGGRRRCLAVLAMPCVGSVSAQGRSTDQAIRLTQRQIQRQPQSATAYFRLGDAYIQKARQTGDLSYCTLAEQALRRSLELAPR